MHVCRLLAPAIEKQVAGPRNAICSPDVERWLAVWAARESGIREKDVVEVGIYHRPRIPSCDNANYVNVAHQPMQGPIVLSAPLCYERGEVVDGM